MMTELQKKSLSIVLNQVQENKMSVDEAMTIIDSLLTNNGITITSDPSPIIRPYFDKDNTGGGPKFPWDNIVYCTDKSNHTPDYPGPMTSTTDTVDYSNVAVKG